MKKSVDLKCPLTDEAVKVPHSLLPVTSYLLHTVRCLRIREDGRPSEHPGPLSKAAKGKAAAMAGKNPSGWTGAAGEDDGSDDGEDNEDLIPWDLIILDGRQT